LVETELLLNEAKERIVNGKILLKNERYNLCVSETYYAMFYGAKALVSLENIAPKTHTGTMSEFSKHYVKTKTFPINLARKYFQFEENRNKADYDVIVKFNKTKAESSLEDANSFIKECEKIIKEKIMIK